MHQIDDQVRVPVRKNVVSASSEPVQPPAFMYGEEIRERFGVLEVRQVACLSQVDMQEDAAVVPGALINKKLDRRKFRRIAWNAKPVVHHSSANSI